MIGVNTGQIVNEIVQSFDGNNNPVTGVTFSLDFYIDGTISNSVVPTIQLANASAATYSVSWSSSTVGFHQFYLRNQTTNVLYVSELYKVVTEADQPIIYVGL
jgi:hypothetical protein